MPPQLTGDGPNYESEKISANLGFPDGLVWSRAGFLAVADVRRRTIFRFDPDPRPKVVRDNDGGASGLAYDSQGRLHICESETRRVTRLDLKDKLDILADSWQGKKFNAPNDVVVRKDGQVYFTDPAFGAAADRREMDFHGVWHITPKGETAPIARWQTRPNGIALSADGRLLFVTDSDRHAVVAFDLDRNGEASGQRDIVKKVVGVPGGIKTDVDGRLYVAARGVAVYSPNGKLERTLIASEYAVNCAFGEAEFESLFISTRSGLYRVKLGVKGALQY